MKIIISIMFLLLTNNIVGQEKTNVEKALSNFLMGDFKEAEGNFSNAISNDTTSYETYYLRGLTRLFQNDTLGAVSDFDNSIRLKTIKTLRVKDSLINSIISVRPKNYSGEHGHDFALDSNLFKIQLATWLFIVENNKKESCNTLRHLELLDIKNIKSLLMRLCK